MKLIGRGNVSECLHIKSFICKFGLNQLLMTSVFRNKLHPDAIGGPLVTALVVALFAVGTVLGQELDPVAEAYIDNPPIWFRSTPPFESSASRLPALDDPARLIWLELRHTEQSIALADLGPADFAMSRLTEYHPNTISTAVAIVNRGVIALQRGEFGRARFFFNDAITEASRERSHEADDIAGTSLYLIAVAHAAERDQPIEKTEGILRDLLEQYPGCSCERDALYLLGELAEVRGDFVDAITIYDRIVDNYPGVSELRARNRRIHSLLSVGRLSDARDELNAFDRVVAGRTQMDTVAPEVMLVQGEARLLRGELDMLERNYPAAEAAFLPLIHPESLLRRPALLGLGATYQAAGHNDSALALYQQILAEDSTDQVRMKAEFNTAVALRQIGRGDDADQRLHDIVSGDRAHLLSDRALVELGIAAYEKQRYAEADSLISVAARTARTRRLAVEAYTLLGAVRLGSNDAVAAIAAFEAADSLSGHVGKGAETGGLLGEGAEARLLRGVTLARVHRSPEAISVLNRFLDDYPEHGATDQALYWLGESYYQSGLFKAAVDADNLLLEQHADSRFAVDALYSKGWAELRLGHYDRAEAAFNQLGKAFPVSAYAVESGLRRGDALYLMGRFDEAFDAYHAALENGPSPDEAIHGQYQSALVEYRRHRLAQADQLFESFATCHSASPLAEDARYLRGEIASQGEQPDRVPSRFGNLLETATRVDLIAPAYLRIADAYKRMNQPDFADAACAIVERRYPGTPFAIQARSLRETLESDRPADDPTATACRGVLAATLARAHVLHAVRRYADEQAELRAVDTGDAGAACMPRYLLAVARNRLVMGDTTAGLEALRTLAARYGSDADARNAMLDLGIVLGQTGAPSEGLAYLNRIRWAAGDSAVPPAVLVAAADQFERLGTLDSARELLHSAAMRNPDDVAAAAAWIRLSTLEIDPQKRAEALEHVVGVAKGNDSMALVALTQLVRHYAAEGNDSAAVGALEDILARFGSNNDLRDSAQLAAAVVYERMGQVGRARTVYQEIIKRNCDGAARNQAEVSLERLGKQ